MQPLQAARSACFGLNGRPTENTSPTRNRTDRPTSLSGPNRRRARIIQTRLSPDGHWLAYTSTDSGREEVYVTTFPTASGRWQISQNDGGYPFWRGDGKELFFAGLSDATAYAVELKINGSQLESSIPQPLFVVRNTSSVGTLFRRRTRRSAFPGSPASAGKRCGSNVPRRKLARHAQQVARGRATESAHTHRFRRRSFRRLRCRRSRVSARRPLVPAPVTLLQSRDERST